MKKYISIILIVLTTGISSCEKDSDEKQIKYPITYKSYAVEEKDTRVFTSAQEILSPLKEQIINKNKINLPVLANMKIAGKIITTYTSEDTVEVKMDFFKKKEIRIAKEISSIVYWEKQDTTLLPYFPIYYFLDLFDMQPLFYEKIEIPTYSGFTTKVLAKECYYAIKDEEELEVPMLDFIFTDGEQTVIATEINNSFNENSIPEINSTDTVTIRAYTIKMEKLSTDTN